MGSNTLSHWVVARLYYMTTLVRTKNLPLMGGMYDSDTLKGSVLKKHYFLEILT